MIVIITWQRNQLLVSHHLTRAIVQLGALKWHCSKLILCRSLFTFTSGVGTHTMTENYQISDRFIHYLKKTVNLIRLRHLCPENVVSDNWEIWEWISRKYMFWWHDREVWALSSDLGDYFRFSRMIFASLHQSVFMVTSISSFIMVGTV